MGSRLAVAEEPADGTCNACVSGRHFFGKKWLCQTCQIRRRALLAEARQGTPCTKCGGRRVAQGRQRRLVCPACRAQRDHERLTQERREQRAAASRRWRANNAQKLLANRLSQYDVTLEQYEAALLRQNGCCAICLGKSPKNQSTRFSVDHDHKTGAFRGLLCGPCNAALGLFNDDRTTLQRALAYLGAT